MRRKSFDVIVGVGGLLLTVALVAAGALLFWGYSFANSSVSSQLSAQRITFPAATAFAQAKPGTEITPGMIPYLEKYAGQQMTTGAQAQAYANHFIAVHLQQIGKGQTYSELSGAAMALPKGSAAFTTAEATVQTVFQGTTLRSMLLNAYGWWQMGQIALIASIVSFVLAGVTLLLSGLGLWHSRRVPAEEEIPNYGTAHPDSWPPAPRRPANRPVRPLRTGAPVWEQPSRGTGASGQDRSGEGRCARAIDEAQTLESLKQRVVRACSGHRGGVVPRHSSPISCLTAIFITGSAVMLARQRLSHVIFEAGHIDPASHKGWGTEW